MRDPGAIAEDVWSILQQTEQRAMREGKRLETAEENLQYLRELASTFVERGWRKYETLGVI
jgi:hypothetical protein